MDQKTARTLLLSVLKNPAQGRLNVDIEHIHDDEWNMFDQMVGHHGISAYVFHQLKIHQIEKSVPQKIKERLREAYLRSAIQNERLYHELSILLSAFQENKIPVIVLKGAYVAQYVYPNIALRPMGDIDLLIRKENFQTVSEIMVGLTYQQKKLYGIESKKQMAEHLAPFIKESAFPVDIHFSVEKPNEYFSFENNEVWHDAQSIVLKDHDVFSLSHEHLLLHLCLHASYLHKFRFGLRALCDISELIWTYQKRIHWDLIEEKAMEWNMKKYIYLTLRVIKDLLNAPIPDPFLERLQPDNFSTDISKTATDLIFQYRDNISQASPFSANLAQLFDAGLSKEKIFLVMKTIFPPRKFIEQKYALPQNSFRVYLYYPIRIKDLLSRYGRSAWGLLNHNQTLSYLAECERDQHRLYDWLK